PSKCSSVDFPTPEAPISATNSPGASVTLAPRRTRTTSGPVRYSFSSSSPARSAGRAVSLIAEHVDRDERSGAPGRNDRGQERQDEVRADNREPVAERELHGQVVDLVHVARQLDDLVRVLRPDHAEADRGARGRPGDADGHA